MRASVRRPSPALAKLCECDLLAADEERRLFRHLKEAREASARLGKDDCRQKGDGRHAHSTARATAIRNRIALSNLRLVVSVAKRFASPQQSVEDLVSEASILLLRCVERFDAGRGTRFSTYATRALTHHFVRLRKRERRRTMHSLSRMPPHRLPLPPRTDAGAARPAGGAEMARPRDGRAPRSREGLARRPFRPQSAGPTANLSPAGGDARIKQRMGSRDDGRRPRAVAPFARPNLGPGLLSMKCPK